MVTCLLCSPTPSPATLHAWPCLVHSKEHGFLGKIVHRNVGSVLSLGKMQTRPHGGETVLKKVEPFWLTPGGDCPVPPGRWPVRPLGPWAVPPAGRSPPTPPPPVVRGHRPPHRPPQLLPDEKVLSERLSAAVRPSLSGGRRARIPAGAYTAPTPHWAPTLPSRERARRAPETVRRGLERDAEQNEPVSKTSITRAHRTWNLVNTAN